MPTVAHAKTDLRTYVRTANPTTSRQVNEARWPHTCSRPCAFEEKKIEKKKHEEIRLTHHTPRNPQQPGDRDHLETTRDETRPTR